MLISHGENLSPNNLIFQGSRQPSPDVSASFQELNHRGDGGDPLSQDVLRLNPPDFMWHMLYLQLITCNELQQS